MKSTNVSIDPRLKSFPNFLYLAWKHLGLPEPTPLQYDIARYLANEENKRIIIEAFRGIGKSFVTSAFVCHQLLLDPQKKILVVSASKQRSDDFVIFTRRLIMEMPVLQHLIPRDDQRSSNVGFDVGPAKAAHAASVRAVGVTGQMTGSRANLIIGDDCESRSNSDTQMQREKLSEIVKEFDAVLSPGGRIVYLGTPQTEESIYNQLEKRGYKCRVWPARYPKDQKKFEAYGGRLAPLIENAYLEDPLGLAWKPTDPLRFDSPDLMEREASYGRSGFQLQFMLDTTLSDAERYPLKLSDLMVMTCDTDKAPVKVVYAHSRELMLPDLPNPGFNGDRYYRPLYVSKEWDNYQGTVMTIDPAGRGKDELGYAVVKCLNGQLYLTASGGLFGGYDETNLVKLATIAMQHKVNYMLIESNFGDGMFTQLIKPVLGRIYPCTVEEIHHTGQKEKRIIDTLEPVLNQHRLVVDEAVIKMDGEIENRDYRLLYQLTHITRDKGSLLHEDRLEAVAMGVAYWLEALSRSQEDLVEEHRTRLFEEELRSFEDHVFGWERPKESLWVSI